MKISLYSHYLLIALFILSAFSSISASMDVYIAKFKQSIKFGQQKFVKSNSLNWNLTYPLVIRKPKLTLNGTLIGYRGFNYSIGYNALNYFKPVQTYHLNTYWGWGTRDFIIPYICIGADYYLLPYLYFGKDYSLPLTVLTDKSQEFPIPSIHLGVNF